MIKLSDYPLLVFVISFVLLSLSGWIGANFLRKLRRWEEGKRKDFGIILGATLTLLGLIIGFSFSMAISRYDQRKNYEEAEANAIGTEAVAHSRSDGDGDLCCTLPSTPDPLSLSVTAA